MPRRRAVSARLPPVSASAARIMPSSSCASAVGRSCRGGDAADSASGAAADSTRVAAAFAAESANPRSSALMEAPRARMVARSITFRNSRTLPGHACISRLCRASADRFFGGSLASARKYSARAMISSRRSRSGDTWILMTLSR
jgi:hypothetical protein